MIVQTRENKDLVIPKSLGNFVTEGSGGGITPEEAAEIASAVTEEAISEYDTELQVDLEEIREAVSANTVTLLDLAEIAVMTVADRVALFDEIYDKAASGESVYIKGLVQEETIRTAILPLVSYRPETNPVLHQGGNLYFAAKGDTDNVYFHIGLTSEGSIDPTSGNIIKRNIYNLPTASAEVKGGVRIGSGLLMTQDTLSVDTTGLVTDGDLAPFIVQLSGNTEDISTLSATTGEISQQIGSLSGLTADIAAISGQTSANTQDIGILSGVTSGLAVDIETLSGSVKEDVILDVAEIYNMDYNDRVTLWDETYAKLIAGHSVFAKGEILNGGGYSALIPLFKYHPETSPQYHTGGFLTFAAKSDEANSFVYYSFSSAGNISPNRANFQQNSIYSLPTASSSTKGGIKVGSGLTMSGDFMSIKAGDGLGFSGDTLVVSGGTGGGPTNYYLNDMSQQELADLYDMLAELTEYDNDSSNIPYIFENYRFFAHTADFDGQQCVQLFFSNWEEQDGDYKLWIGGMLPTKASYPVNIHRTVAIILSDGTLQMSDSNLAEIDNAANDFQIRINSNGYIASDVLDYFSSLVKFNRFVFVYQDENITNNYCAAPLKYFYRKNETVGGEDKLVEYIGVEININGTWYKGDWHFAEYGWSEWNAPDTWTTI